ncbi:MAG: metal-dependent hydrolase [Chlorobium sp.]|uniref:metal-dependent hydrolase n=1 Tax=Chlorobium sp. TaxID=1095 RepID=UPI0025C432A7|nr:metal-dependent hydrolase [Chlorobium sp.]MCF8215885.1 metal-dependent hydrolase [Chlorobium sp.]MCF8270783.1 metal-dependent hydrolase [Chlorobium sp.]MCF8287095.1 metal-dependent hydrolase [Chlorobium sp.]MCF8290752.1 metal-dependent hydrolase [Chlorobium sp.]MCF8384856.1 metal-dependent hydrolase [Chlorobium sp.]
MVLGHLPVGYIISKMLFRTIKDRQVKYRTFMFWGLFGSVAPDTDMIYYYLFDYRQYSHHQYVTHFPLLWLFFLLLSFVWILFHKKWGQYPVYAVIFTLGGFVHILMDTIVGGSMLLLAPFDYRHFCLVPHVPWDATQYKFLSYGLEAILILWAVLIWLKIRVHSEVNRA